MNEDEWLGATDPAPMLEFLRGKVSERKWRLFAVACCRRQPAKWEETPREKLAVEVAEQFCDGLADRRALDQAQEQVEGHLELYPGEPVYSAGFWACSEDIVHDAESAAGFAANSVARSKVEFSSPDFDDEFEAARKVELSGQSDLLRDVFGNPFQPIAFDPSWKTEAVIAIARGMYETRDFSAAPVLADALEDAGCSDVAILGHLRGGGQHVRGCWCVDGVLGLE